MVDDPAASAQATGAAPRRGRRSTDVAPLDAVAGAAAEGPLRLPRALELKALLLLLLLALLLGAATLYVLYARGAFEATRRLTLVVDNAEGIGVGSDLSFAGFPIGRARRIELAADGNAHIIIDVAEKDAKWLRSSSIFTLERGLVGGARLRAFSGVLSDPELPPDSTRPLLVGDAAAEIPKLVGATKALIDNLNALLAADGSIGATLANLRGFSDRLNAPGGAVGALLGDGADSRQIALTLQRTNALLARLDTLAANADKQVFGPDGLARDARTSVRQLDALLTQARASLKKVDAVLAEAQAVGANARAATDDLGALRGDIDANLRKIEQLINELNRKWPFARATELKLP